MDCIHRREICDGEYLAIRWFGQRELRCRGNCRGVVAGCFKWLVVVGDVTGPLGQLGVVREHGTTRSLDGFIS